LSNRINTPGNQVFIKEQIYEANLFAEQHKTEFGYTDVFIRKENPVSTITKEIRVDYLRSTIVSFQLPELLRMRYEGGEEKPIRGLKTHAFGFSCFTLFFDTKDEFVNNIWAKINLITSVKEFDIILNSLYYLGEENDLILIDWNDDSIVNLKDKTQIKNYLGSVRKVVGEIK